MSWAAVAGPDSIDSWRAFVVWMVLAAAILIGAVSGVVGAVKAHRNGSVSDEIKDQVKNTHDSNLRDDLDRVDTKVDQVDTKVDELVGTTAANHLQMVAFMSEMRAQMTGYAKITANCPLHKEAS